MEQTINIEQIFSILRKYRRLILSSTVVCTLLAVIVTGSYDGITDKLFDIIHHKGAFYYGN